MLEKLIKIGRLIKYDGKPPMSDDEIIELTLIEHEKDQVILKAELRRVRQEKERIERNELMLERDKQKVQDELDAEESRLDGELDYYDQMTIACPKCGDDIMDIDAKCTALACSKRQSGHVRAYGYAMNPIYGGRYTRAVE